MKILLILSIIFLVGCKHHYQGQIFPKILEKDTGSIITDLAEVSQGNWDSIFFISEQFHTDKIVNITGIQNYQKDYVDVSPRIIFVKSGKLVFQELFLEQIFSEHPKYTINFTFPEYEKKGYARYSKGQKFHVIKYKDEFEVEVFSIDTIGGSVTKMECNKNVDSLN